MPTIQYSGFLMFNQNTHVKKILWGGPGAGSSKMAAWPGRVVGAVPATNALVFGGVGVALWDALERPPRAGLGVGPPAGVLSRLLVAAAAALLMSPAVGRRAVCDATRVVRDVTRIYQSMGKATGP